MERLLASIAKLDRWAVENHVDLSRELASIVAKIKKTHKRSDAPQKVKSTNSSKSLKKVKTIDNKQQTKPLSEPPTATSINFDKRSKIIKGISYCRYCRVNRLECREHELFDGTKVLICKDCRLRRHRKYLKKKNEYFVKEDALFHLVSGSYGSGKANR
ncbi:hypothetical protein [Shewanella sp. 10N.286.52.B9]|uniref:hypothetical protein n=1 Tax=Shewanella sp. 10N.286.52.B9 TaxID=1880837 RepID=UPI000C866077|nr:hypothetical protein [Shewanella sp. 10N.286.52.B9]PMG50700.1 hypothetical protein BCU91_17270 [Shewanella sp. 10N.286.52.B9]